MSHQYGVGILKGTCLYFKVSSIGHYQDFLFFTFLKARPDISPVNGFHSFFFFKGIVAFWSDCHTLGLTSISHIIDRIMAPTLTIWFLFRNLLMKYPHVFPYCDNYVILDDTVTSSVLSSSTIQSILLFILVPFSLYIFYQSQVAVSKKMYLNYIFWHGMWHICFPIVYIISTYFLAMYSHCF
jgi:hypothetical protein